MSKRAKAWSGRRRLRLAEYPLPPEVIHDIEHSELNMREIQHKHGFNEDSFRAVLRDMYDYDMHERRARIYSQRQLRINAEKRAKAFKQHEQAVHDLLDNTVLTTLEIARELGININLLYEIVSHIGYDTNARGRRIMAQRAEQKIKTIDPIDAPMCDISREWLGKRWTTNEVENG